MTKVTSNLIATLKKELSIIQELIEDAHALRAALNSRDGNAIHRLVSQRQTAIMQLQMVQHAKTSILKNRTKQRVSRTNLRSLILQTAPSSSVALLEELESALVLLHQLNEVNEMLLTKYRSAAHSYNHLVEMKLGVEQTYNHKGLISAKRPTRLERHG